MSLFRKSVDAAGVETLIEVDLHEVELPEDHPTILKMKAARLESKKRRDKISTLKNQIAKLSAGDADEGDDQEPEEEVEDEPLKQPAHVATQPSVINEEAVVTKALSRLKADQAAEAKTAADRKAGIDSILKETGLSETFRPVIEAIPDLGVGKAHAAFLAKEVLHFDQTPSGGNGEVDPAAIMAGVSKKLGLVKTP